MAGIVRVVVDAMGGDNAPVEPVKGAVEAVKERKEIHVLLTGQKDVIEKELAKYRTIQRIRSRSFRHPK